MSDEPQGTVYAAYVAMQLQREYDRRDSINSRAGAAITASTGLVTLVLAVIAFSRGKDYVAHGAALGFIIVAVALLLVSGGLAVRAGMPRSFDVRDIATLRELLLQRWTESETTDRNTTAFLTSTNSPIYARATLTSNGG